MSHQRDSLKAGLFVLAGLVLGLLCVFLLADFSSWFTATQRIRVFYSLSDGLPGIREGAEVTLGDQPVGIVSGIASHQEETPDGPRITGVLVTLHIPADIAVYQDASIELVVPPLGNTSRLNIRSVGQGARYDGREPIRGEVAGSALTRSLAQDAGIGDEQRRQIAEIIRNVEAITATLREDLPELSTKVGNRLDELEGVMKSTGAAVEDAKAVVADAKAVMQDLREHSDQWIKSIDQVAASTQSTMERVDQMTKDLEPQVRDTITGVQETVAKIRGEGLDKFAKAMDSAVTALDAAREGMAELRDTSTKLHSMLTSQRPVIERFLANLSLTSTQLKLAAVEVRRSPWRLMYVPSEQELTSDNLYDAARSFVMAAESLETAVTSLSTLARERPDEQERIAKMMGYLEELFGRFTQAETGFWKALSEQAAEQ